MDENINPQAYLLIKKLFNPEIKISISTKKCFENYLSYLEKLYSSNFKAAPKEKNIFDMLFFVKGVPRKSYSNFCKTHLHTGIETLKNYQSYLKLLDRYNVYGLKDFGFLIREIVFDLRPFVIFFEKKNNPDFEYLRFEKSNSSFSFQLNNAASKLALVSFYKNILVDRFTLIEVVPHVLRASIEKKIKRTLGIGAIYFQDDFSSPLIRNQFYFSFLKNNSDLIVPQGFELNLIEKIYKWCNAPIHNGYRPRIHELDFALKYSSKLFSSNHDSLFSSVQIKNYKKVKQLLLEGILIELKNKPFQMNWVEPEAHILS